MCKIVLRSSGGVPFEWRYKILNNKVVELVDSKVVSTEPDMDGSPIESYYYFKGLKPGKTKVIFDYVYFDDNKSVNTISYELKVDKLLKVNVKLLNK